MLLLSFHFDFIISIAILLPSIQISVMILYKCCQVHRFMNICGFINDEGWRFKTPSFIECMCTGKVVQMQWTGTNNNQRYAMQCSNINIQMISFIPFLALKNFNNSFILNPTRIHSVPTLELSEFSFFLHYFHIKTWPVYEQTAIMNNYNWSGKTDDIQIM